MKKKVLLSSIMTIILCLSLIAGSTFALFTSTYNVGIAVTAGKVDVVAGIAITKLESVKADANGRIVDENGGRYSYETVSPTFTNGGTAVVENGVLTLDKITPGDKVTFEISGKNNSNVAVQYRYLVECTEGEMLMSGLIVNDGTTDYPALSTYTSPWFTLESGKNVADRAPVIFSIELPVTAGNEYQEKKTSIKVTLEAVQGNAVVEDNRAPVVTYIEKVDTVDAAQTALADPNKDYVLFTGDVADAITVGDISNKIIDANGNNATLKFTGALDNVVITGIQDNGDATPAIQFSGATGSVTIMDSMLVDHNSTPYGAIAGATADLEITVINCELEGARPVYYSGAVKSFALIDSTVNYSGSWAVLYNNAVYGDVTIDGCTFENCEGIFKALYDISGNFTFTNNTLVDCTLKNNVYVEAKVVGDIIVSGNTMIAGGVVVDNDVTAADLLGVVKK